MATNRKVIYVGAQTLKTVILSYATTPPQIWNTSGTPAFEAYNAAHIAAYGIATTQLAGSLYYWTVPGLPPTTAGQSYESVTFACAAGSLAAGDLVIPVYEDVFSWDGTKVSSNVLPPPPSGNQLIGYFYTQMPGTTIYYAMTTLPPGTGLQFDGVTNSHTSDSSGLWAVPLYYGAIYSFNCGNGPTINVVIPNSGSTLPLQNLLGL